MYYTICRLIPTSVNRRSWGVGDYRKKNRTIIRRVYYNIYYFYVHTAAAVAGDLLPNTQKTALQYNRHAARIIRAHTNRGYAYIIIHVGTN